MQFLQRLIENFIKEHVRRKRLYRVVSVLACIVVFVTTYAMILPAITLDRETAEEQPGIEVEAAGEEIDPDGDEADESGESEESSGEESDDEVNDGENNPQASVEISVEEDASAAEKTENPKNTESVGAETTETNPENAESAGAETTETDPENAGAGITDQAGTEIAADTEEKLLAEGTVLHAKGRDYDVYATITAESGLYEGTTLEVREITKEEDEEEYQLYIDRAQEELRGKYDGNTSVSFAKFYDISFLYKGEKIEPAGDVGIRIEYKEPVEVAADAGIDTVHFDVEKEEKPQFVEAELKTEDGRSIRTGAGEETTQPVAEPVKIDKIEFASESFSVYGVVGSTIEKTVLAGDGRNYRITVEYGSDAGIPAGTELEVNEITLDEDTFDNDTEYDLYIDKSSRTLGFDSAIYDYARFFDISLVKDGDKIQPAEGSSIHVKIELADTESDSLKVLHFADGTDEGDLLETSFESGEEGKTVEFETTGFSVYAVVDAKEAFVSYVKSLDELGDNTDKEFLLSYTDIYFTNSLNSSGCFVETRDPDDAARWYFEKIDGQDNQYYIYTMQGTEKKYIKQVSANNNNITLDAAGGTAFVISRAADGLFYLKHATEGRWLQHSNGGKGIRFYTDNNNAANSRIRLTYADAREVPDDYYELDGKTYGIAYDAESIFCTAMMADSQSAGSLDGLDMPKLDKKGYTDRLFVAQDSTITDWTFHTQGNDNYYITANVDGEERYLTINNGSVTLESEPQGGSLIKIAAGMDQYEGFYSFSSGDNYLTVAGEEGSRYFTATKNGNTDSCWLKLAEESPLSKDDYLIYTAQKISVSDPADKVVLYTRVWNETKKQYEFYAVDHDGSLIRCYDDGDVIKWVGNQYETAVWELTDNTRVDEHGERVPDGTYELFNPYSGKYIKPNMEEGSVFSDSKVYLNLDGRFYKEEYTKVRCWDTAYYSYIGMKADLESGRVVPCPSSQASDFYFARVKLPQVHLTEVDTVDNDEYGITMKMIDFNNRIENGRDSVQTEYFGRDSDRTGLLSTDIKANGYPDATVKGSSLAGLFGGDQEVNHLFIQSVYDESGYFEYDSTKNFAYLNGSQFQVYDQLGTVERPENKVTMYHGQFMPYNSLIDPKTGEPWPYSDMYTNKTSVTADPLSEDDPRYGEGLHEIPRSQADYFFGMEMSADFTQTPDGLDAWGHDIIFEFSGDDDFWFYVDDELVLDLGGVHQAMTGSVNFRTGIVTGRNGSTKTLRQIFRDNYLGRNPEASEEDVNNYLNQFFDEGSTVFRDYSTHSMRVIYMERGAGASNLYMRFNLTAVKPGEVTLSKKVTGSDDIDYSLMEFPYQILYRTANDIPPGGEDTGWQQLVQNEYDPAVTYQGSKRPVKFYENFTPVGETQSYTNVFFMKAGEIASIKLPSDAVDYKIVECGVNMNIFKSVKANGETLSGEGDEGRHNYEVPASFIEERPEVKYENEVDPDSLRTLTISKVLWDENGYEVIDKGTDRERREGNKLIGYVDDDTTFDFRVYMSAPGVEEPVLVNGAKYYVKNPDGFYCRWDANKQQFVSLGIGNYNELVEYMADRTDEEIAAIRFETSTRGAVSRIPGSYSVEFRGLPVDSSFRVEEWDNEIPKGYNLVEYERDKGSYYSEEDPNEGTIRANEDPHVLVHNKRGWGLTVNKVWSDATFMDSHDDIYFAVYVKDPSTEELTLLTGSERKMTSSMTSLYYYFDKLEEGASFDDYEIFEVKLTNPRTDEEGKLIYDSIERIGQGGTLTVGGKPKNKEHQEGFHYKVSYEKGESSGGYEGVENVRTDTVTNTRKGIRLQKTDWTESPLPGAVFTLKDEEGVPVGADSYTSDAEGLITIAYLDPGTTYTLEETKAPSGFQKPSTPWTILLNGEEVTVTGDDGSFIVTTPQTGDEMTAITFKDKGFSLQALKVNEDEQHLQGSVFALYRQVNTASGLVRDQNPMEGYEELTTGEDGVIPKITSALPAGSYYLSEVSPPGGYKKLGGDLVFTIGIQGTVTIPLNIHTGDPSTLVILNNLEGSKVDEWLSSSTEEGNTTYTILIPNEYDGVPVRIVKKDQTGKALEEAVFSISGEGIDETGLISKIDASGDAVIYTNQALSIGTYTLTETGAPKGYYPLEGPMTIEVEKTGNDIEVKAFIGGKEISYPDVIKDHTTGVWTIKVTNQSGTVLPATGGSGTGLFMIAGLILTAGAGILLLLRRAKIM